MSKVSPKRRKVKIRQKRKRQFKLKKLREKYFSLKSVAEKQKLKDKVTKTSPLLDVEDYLGKRTKD